MLVTKQVVQAKRIALRDTLVAASEGLSTLGTLRAASVSLINLTSVIYVGHEEADGEKVLRRFSLYPGSHDNCLHWRLSAYAPLVITKGRHRHISFIDSNNGRYSA